jgi:uncharacterized protein (DUF2141 family)
MIPTSILLLNTMSDISTQCLPHAALFSKVVFAKTLLAAFVGTALFSSQAAFAEDSDRHDLVVQVIGLNSNQGQVVANLFKDGDDIFGKPRFKTSQRIVDRAAIVTFANLQPGRYALTVFHDINGNNDLDHNMFRFPAEPLGFSNGFELSLFSGLPSFEKLAFSVGPDTQTINIHLK